jgi:hypothetical protein
MKILKHNKLNSITQFATKLYLFFYISLNGFHRDRNKKNKNDKCVVDAEYNKKKIHTSKDRLILFCCC